MAAIAEILSSSAITPFDAPTGDSHDTTDDKLTVADLVQLLEESEDASIEARKNSERDRDYHDGKQLTAEEISELGKRGQPPMIDNRIKSKVDYLVGLEKQQRVDPRAFPRTPQHEQDADGCTQALRYVSQEQNFDYKRSAVWRNLLVEGAAGYRCYIEEDGGYGGQQPQGYGNGSGGGKPKICIQRVAWDRMFWDPHSSESDFSDAGYLGLVLWLDMADARARWPDAEAQDALDTTMASAPTDTYDDKPKFQHWADKKRKRVRVCQIWIKRDENWHFAEFTKGGILKAGPSPYVDDKGNSDCELLFQSAYVDRDNNRYGLVSEMISLQDAINKRHSKALHILNTAQVWIDEDALPAKGGIEKLRKEANRPDGTIVLNPGSMANGKLKIETRADLAAAQVELLQHTLNAIDLKGPNATAMGDKAQGSSAASGRAILASQQGGMVSLGDLLDNLRHLDVRLFRAVWARIRQYWTAEEWVRVTDDERNLKWVGLNVDPMMVQQAMQQNPAMAAKISGVVANVAELDCDIIIDDAPDNMTPQIEQFQALVELKKMDANNDIPFKAIVEAIPNLKDRSKFLNAMDEAAKQPKPPPPEMLKMQMEQQAAQQSAQIEQQKAQTDAQLKQAQMQADMQMEQQRAQLEREKAQSDIEMQRAKAAAELQLKRETAEAELELKARTSAMDHEQRSREMEMTHQQRNREMAADHDHRQQEFAFDADLKSKQTEVGGEKTSAPILKALKEINEGLRAAQQLAQAETEVIIERDPKTNRMTKATKRRKAA